MSVNTPPTIDSPNTATFYAGSASSFTVFGTGYPTPIFYTWDEAILAAPACSSWTTRTAPPA